MQAQMALSRMSRANRLLYRSYSWRKGAVLHDKDIYAEIIDEWEHKRLLVKVKGLAPQELFNTINQELEKIIAELKNNKMILRLNAIPEGFYKEKWRQLAHLEDLQHDFRRQKDPGTGLNLFVSYAREDVEYKNELIGWLDGLIDSKRDHHCLARWIGYGRATLGPGN